VLESIREQGATNAASSSPLHWRQTLCSSQKAGKVVFLGTEGTGTAVVTSLSHPLGGPTGLASRLAGDLGHVLSRRASAPSDALGVCRPAQRPRSLAEPDPKLPVTHASMWLSRSGLCGTSTCSWVHTTPGMNAIDFRLITQRHGG
jgi:hypothetical protein